MSVDGHVSYDYAWDTPGWTVQNPSYPLDTSGGYYDLGLPEDISKVRVWGKFLEWDTGRPLEGVLRIRTSKILTYVPENTQVMPGVKRLRFLRGGFSIYLPATDDLQLTPNGFTYLARLTVRGTTQEFEFALPSTPAEVNITTLIGTP